MQRVTNMHVSNTFLENLRRVQVRLADTNRQLSTQERIGKPADDPFGTAQIIDFDGQLQEVRQFQRNLDDASGMLGTADSALDDVGKAISRLRELVVQASNSTNSQADLANIAAEARELKEAIRDKANARYGSTFIFSGTATATEAYPSPGNTYAGTNNAIARRVAPNLAVNISVDGPAVFGTTTGATPAQMNLFDLVDRTVANLMSGAPAAREELRTDVLDAFDDRLDAVLQQRAGLGVTQSRLETTRMQLADTEERVMQSRSSVADVDAAKTYMDLQQQNTMYQAALAAGSRIMQTSPLDFI